MTRRSPAGADLAARGAKSIRAPTSGEAKARRSPSQLPVWTEAAAQTGSVRPGHEHFGMAQNVIEGRGEQGFLLPPDLREWLPGDHLAWFVMEAVAEMDLSAFMRPVGPMNRLLPAGPDGHRDPGRAAAGGH
jgi:hypothetical protein